jgi:hypothetical protein
LCSYFCFGVGQVRLSGGTIALKFASRLHCIPHATPTLKPHQDAENDSVRSNSIF